ncbi:methylmalonic aciduria and homocystinuria type D protein, mitochondrial [Eurytemora carolleeae]|uniref:methylmalonic aciduria and homocystinuria type D protein, mitochondrial n=1 Tax=Eurytemora carolleeae TaxID=1294199 RepID=UPI000C76C6D4|nr:methylmalonic aciduria and homocystinuria type D protein, mitochondrial [Eurytemora carolleeae]|eukprot:XP_023338224.1 methylmalonic aciduria and homocystinuria type D protein, mitochondrial-like [Eurytemora affinis]
MAGTLANFKSKGLSSSRFVRSFSGAQSGGSRGWKNETPQGSKTEVFVYSPESNITWPDPQLGVLGSSDPFFTFPGHIGCSLTGQLPEKSSPLKPVQPDILTAPTNKETQVHALYNASDYIKYTPGSESLVCADILDEYPKIVGMESVQFGVHDTPLLLRKEMKALFPSQNIDNGNFTTITYSQKTENDMSKWSDQVEDEREKKMESFVQAAKEICARLKEDGFWADFLDPCSGTPYYGVHTNTTMFETDEKFRLLGFRIEDLGCCKVILHPKYGRNVFVGCIVTNAGKNSPVLEEILEDIV